MCINLHGTIQVKMILVKENKGILECVLLPTQSLSTKILYVYKSGVLTPDKCEEKHTLCSEDGYLGGV